MNRRPFEIVSAALFSAAVTLAPARALAMSDEDQLALAFGLIVAGSNCPGFTYNPLAVAGILSARGFSTRTSGPAGNNTNVCPLFSAS